MANDLTTTDQADGPRDLAWKALSLLTSTTERAIAELGDDAAASVNAALAKTEHEMRAVPKDGAARAEWETAIDERLRRLAVKVLPTATPAQTQEWRGTMVEALSNLPAMIALTAAKRAIHLPFRFIGEIEPAIREVAAELIQVRDQRKKRLEQFRAEIERGANPPMAIAGPAEDQPITADQIRAMKPEFRSLGLKAGWITQADIDAALGDSDQAQAA